MEISKSSFISHKWYFADKDLDQIREHINFPTKRAALLNSIARNFNGKPTAYRKGLFINLTDEDSFNKIAEGAWSRLWSKFLIFRTVSAGVTAIIMIVKFLKPLIDTAIKGYTLHSIYGWFVNLLHPY